jgi:SH3 domain-containing YSC84-like protein 1
MRHVVVAVIFSVLSSAASAATHATTEVDGATVVFNHMIASHQIPQDVFTNSECIAIFPAVPKAGAIVGGKHGGGVVSCRGNNGWSAPAFISITAASVGLQLGLERQDIVLLMNKQAEQQLSGGHWVLGAEAVASGPNKQSTGGLDSRNWKTPVLVYTSTSGEYVGLNLEGSKISMDETTMRDLYGPDTTLQSVLNGDVPPPGSAHPFLTALNQASEK